MSSPEIDNGDFTIADVSEPTLPLPVSPHAGPRASTPEFIVVKGPPGTGKTSWLLDRFKAELRSAGDNARELMVVSFTTNAADVAKGRLQKDGVLSDVALSSVSTLHAKAWELLRGRFRFHGEKERAAFRAEFFPALPAKEAASFDQLFDAGRQSGGVDALVSTLTGVRARINAALFLEYAERLNEYLTREMQADYTRMLELVLEFKLKPDVRAAFFDEAQDFTPLQARVVELWASGCERVYVVGDDDQAIFDFSGASSSWFLDMYRKHGGTGLTQSWRVPRVIHAEAQNIISKVEGRITIAAKPADTDGEVVRDVPVQQVPQFLDGDKNLILARENWMLDKVEELLAKVGVQVVRQQEHAAERLRHARAGKAALTAEAVRLGLDVSSKDLVFLAAVIQDVKSNLGAINSFGAKAVPAAFYRKHLAFMDALSASGSLAFLGPYLTSHEMAQASVVLAKTTTETVGRIELATLHASKGSEADCVAILPDLTSKTYAAVASDETHRLFYVGMTRARRRLILCQPLTLRSKRYPF